MYVPKKGFFANLLSNEAEIICDVCHSTLNMCSAIKNAKNEYSVINGSNNRMLCVGCFSQGITNYRMSDFDQHSPTFSDNCSICKTKVNPIKCDIANEFVRHICSSCLKNKTHPDNKHNYRNNYSNKLISSCEKCGSLRLIINGNYKYYQINSRQASSLPIPCVPHQLNNYSCEHAYIRVADFRKDQKNIYYDDMLRKEKSIRNRTPGLWGDDDYPLIDMESYAASINGYVLNWCIKCGEVEKQIDREYIKYV